MKGYIHIEAAKSKDAEGISIACNLEHVNTTDKFRIIESVCRALKFTKHEWMLFVCLKDEGVFNEMFNEESVELKLPIKKEE